MAEIDFHLGLCSECASRWTEQDRYDALLREAGTAEEPEVSAVLAHVRKQMHATSRVPFKILATLAATAAVATALLLVATRAGLPQAAPALFLDAAGDHTDEVIKQEPREWVRGENNINQFVTRELAVTRIVPALAPEGYHIDRAKICQLQNQLYVHLVYSNGSQEISFYVRHNNPGQMPGHVVERVNGTPLYAGQADGLEVAGFQRSDLSVLLVGNIPAGEALRFAAHAVTGI
jgi:anti-sigma factor RsiW